MDVHAKRTYISLDPAKGWPAGSDVYYECLRCGEVIPSLPAGSRECACGNIAIDVEYGRFVTDDVSQVRAFVTENGT